MKKLLGAAAALVLVAGASSAMAAQGSTTVHASATVVAPISMSETDMAFGKLVNDATATGGTVVLGLNNTRSATGGINLVGGTAGTTGSVTVTSDGSNAYDLTFPASATLNGPNSATMTVDTFTTSAGTISSNKVAGLTTSGTYTVGATLHVAGNQAAGAYTGQFDVTAAYQ